MAIRLPKQALDKLNVKEGDTLTISENESGISITAYDPNFEKAMESFERFASKYKNALKELAK